MKKLLAILLLGICLRLCLMAVGLHPDFRSYNLAAYFIAQKGELFSFYDHLRLLPRDNPLVQLYHDDLFIYPPLAYQTHAAFNLFLYPFYPQSAFWTLITDIGKSPAEKAFPLLLILLKLPYLVADLCLLFVFLKLVPTKKTLALLIWAFNPLVLYTTYLMGQFDIFITLGISLAILALSAKRPKLSAIILGFSAGFKPFPLFLLPFLPGKLITNLFLGIFSYLLIIAPYLVSIGYRQYALLAPQTDKMLYAKIMVSGSQYISIFFLGYTILWWLKNKYSHLFPDWAWLGIPLAMFYSFTNFHPQWILWFVPFGVLLFIRQPQTRPLLAVLTLIFFLIILFFDTSLNFGLLGISFSLSQLMSARYPPDQLVSILRSVFAGTLLALFLFSGKFTAQLKK